MFPIFVLYYPGPGGTFVQVALGVSVFREVKKPPTFDIEAVELPM